MTNHSDESLEMIEQELNRRCPVNAQGGETAAGWLARVVTAAIEYGRGEQTAERWDQLWQVMHQAEAFFARQAKAVEECHALVQDLRERCKTYTGEE